MAMQQYTRTCDFCQTDFTAQRNTARFCSAKCRKYSARAASRQLSRENVTPTVTPEPVTPTVTPTGTEKPSGLKYPKTIMPPEVAHWFHSRCAELRAALPKALSEQSFQTKLDKWFMGLIPSAKIMQQEQQADVIANLNHHRAQIKKREDELQQRMDRFNHGVDNYDTRLTRDDLFMSYKTSRQLMSVLHEDKYQDAASKDKVRKIFIELKPLFDVAATREAGRKKEFAASEKRKAAAAKRKAGS